MNLSHHTVEEAVYNFDSTWDQDKQVLVRDAGTESMENKIEISTKANQTAETKDVGVS